MTTRRASAMLALALAASGCSEPPPAPPMPDAVNALDPDVASLVQRLADDVREDPRDGERRLQLGMAYEANALPDLARDCYEQVLAREPDHVRARYRLALVQDDPGVVRAELERVVELSPAHAPAWWRLGFARMDAGELAAARDAFEEARRIDPTDVAARNGLARVLLQEDRATDALELLEILVDERPGDLRLAQLLHATRLRLGLPSVPPPTAPTGPAVHADSWQREAARYWVGYSADLARADAALAAGDAREALRLLERHRARRSDDVTFLTVHGAALARSGRGAEGIATLGRALSINPAAHSAHAHLADALRKEGRLGEALRHAVRASELAPGSATAHEVRGAVLHRLGRREPALLAFERAVTCDPGRLRSRRFLGGLQFEMHRFEDALATYEVAVKHGADDAKSWLGLGMARLELGRMKEAEEALRRAERLGPRGKWQVHLVLDELARRRAGASRR